MTEIAYPPRKPRMQGLQALRGAACLGVFAQHVVSEAGRLSDGPTALLSSLNPGGIAVFLFFALSGYLMADRAGDPAGRFLLDRVRRIYPALWIALLLGAGALMLLHGVHGLTWEAFLLVPAGAKPITYVPMWTLYFEALFYGLLFVLILVSRRAIVPVVVIWAVVSFVFRERPYDPEQSIFPDAHNFIFQVFALNFAAGVLAYQRFGPASRGRIAYTVGAAACLIGAVTVWRLPIYGLVPGTWMSDIIFLLMTAGAFLAVRACALWAPRRWPGRMLAKVGDLSYGFYLTHVIPLEIAYTVLKQVGAPESYWLNIAILLAWALPVALLLGLAEVRFQSWLRRLEDRALASRWARRWRRAAAGPSAAPVPSAPSG